MKPISIFRMIQGSGAPPALDTQTVTVAQTGTLGTHVRGYKSTATAQGSINDGTSNIFGGGSITEMFVDEELSQFYLTITGSTDGSWTTLTNATAGTSLSRASASFSGGKWTWSGQALNGFFANSSGAVTVNFT